MRFVRAARVRGPGVSIYSGYAWLLAAIAVALGLVLGACGDGPQPRSSAARRAWEGPDARVASTGITVYERREIAQKVELPVCIEVAPTRYRFARVSVDSSGGTTPSGYLDTMYRLDRWRIYRKVGATDPPATLYLTVRGSTGILAEYDRDDAGPPCT